jgi:hypothetical protein
VKSCSQHQYASQHDLTADTFPDLNRVVTNSSDADARIERVAAPVYIYKSLTLPSG